MNPFYGRLLFVSVGVRIRELLVAASVIAAFATVVSLGARWWWPLELCTHFRVHCFVGLMIGAAICVWTKRRKLAITLALAAAYNLALIVPLYGSANTIVDSKGRAVRLLLANVHVHNRKYAALLQLVKETSPDIVLTMEVNSDWVSALEPLSAEYPHHLSRPRADSFGIALWSRLPVDRLTVESIGPAEVPSIVAHFDRSLDGSFTLIGTHPLPPMGAEYASLRNEQLHVLGEFAAGRSEPTLLAGDLNITSWSPFFRDLLTTSGLRDSRIGFGIQPTWLSQFVWIGIPIDHVLVSPEIVVLRRIVGPDIGSDHRPVIIDFVAPTSNDSDGHE